MEPKLNKTELNADLARINSRIRFLNAAFYGIAKDRDTLAELAKLHELREFTLAELKK